MPYVILVRLTWTRDLIIAVEIMSADSEPCPACDVSPEARLFIVPVRVDSEMPRNETTAITTPSLD